MPLALMHTDPSGTDPSTEMIRMLFSMLAFYALASTASTPERPNVLLITAKDFVLAALGCYSGKTGEELKAEGK